MVKPRFVGDKNGSEPAPEQKRKRVQEKKVWTTLKSIVDKRKEAKVEFGYTVDLDGTVLVMNRGGRSSCKITDCWDKIGIHNHPRGERGEPGGTFSPADLRSMLITNRPRNFAIDQEFIYELRAIGWKPKGNDNLSERYQKGIELHARYNAFVQQSLNKSYTMANEARMRGEFRDPKTGVSDPVKYVKYQTKAWNDMLRTWLKNNAGSFGYEYHEHRI